MRRRAAPQTVTREGPGASAPFVPPYPPSWVDRLLDGIDRLPGPTWAGFSAIGLGMIGLGFIFGPLIDPGGSPLTWVVFIAPLALIRYLDAVALRSLKRFRPALAASDEDVRRMAYELTTMGRTAGWLAAAASVAVILTVYVAYPSRLPDLARQQWYQTTPLLLFYAFLAALYFALPVYAIRQLRLVTLIHRRATNLNLLQPQPLYAFSSLTVRAAIGLLILGYASLLDTDTDVSQRVPALVVFGLMVLAATGMFVLPLYGMHVRLAQEKDRLLAEHQARLDAVMNAFHKMAEKPNPTRAEALEKVLAALMIERDLLAKAPTWPWRPGTVGSFASAVLLPVGLWLITRLLERLAS